MSIYRHWAGIDGADARLRALGNVTVMDQIIADTDDIARMRSRYHLLRRKARDVLLLAYLPGQTGPCGTAWLHQVKNDWSTNP